MAEAFPTGDNKLVTNKYKLTGSQLVDRVSALEAEKAALEATAPASPATGKQSTSPSATPTPSSAAESRLRLDLAEALRSKGQLENRLRAADEELLRLRAKTSEDVRNLREIGSERRALAVRLRDRDDELRQKNKLVADVQDELAVLNLQLTVAERERDKAIEENKQLVDRWMRKMGQVAEAMNLANEPELAKKP
jgi:chromosome segregation ATPase